MKFSRPIKNGSTIKRTTMKNRLLIIDDESAIGELDALSMFCVMPRYGHKPEDFSLATSPSG